MSISLILQTLLSTAAVMATVLLILFVVTGIGLLTSFSWQQGVGVRIRSAIWLGWFWVAVYVSTAHLFFAMKPPVAIPLIIAGLTGWFLLIRKSGFPQLKLRGQPWWVYGAWAALFALFGLLSNQTLRAPIYHSDAGWYRIPYITVSQVAPEIPGVANLNPQFAFGHLSDKITGLLSGFVPDGAGFSLINSLFVSSLIVDVGLRVLNEPTMQPHKAFLGVNQIFSILTFTSLLLICPWTSIWIASPTVDVPTTAVFIAGVSYAIESIEKNNLSLSLVAIFSLGFSAALRPSNVIVCAAVILITIYGFKTRYQSIKDIRRIRDWMSPTLVASSLGVFIGASTLLLASFIRSGFPLHPISGWSPIAADWSLTTDDVIGARDKVQDLGLAWTVEEASALDEIDTHKVLSALVSEPVVQIAVAGLLISFAVWILARRTAGPPSLEKHRVGRYAVIWTSCVGIIVVTAWAAPDPRFFWGPLLTIGLLPLAVATFKSESLLALTPRNSSPFVIAIAMSSVMFLAILFDRAFLGSALIKPVVQSYTGILTFPSVPDAEIQFLETKRRLKIAIANSDAKCWQQEPPCSFTLDERLELRGETLREGFRIRQ